MNVASLNGGTSEPLCLACGLCCNGVIFADVKLQSGEDAARFQSLGLAFSTPSTVRSGVRTPRFMQPCAALEGCRCRIYGERPKHCRAFECALLKSAKAGQVENAAALRIIHEARDRAEKVRGLLRALGDNDEQSPLSARFRRTSKRVETMGLDEMTAEKYGALTLAVHDLNMLVKEAFYP